MFSAGQPRIFHQLFASLNIISSFFFWKVFLSYPRHCVRKKKFLSVSRGGKWLTLNFCMLNAWIEYAWFAFDVFFVDFSRNYVPFQLFMRWIPSCSDSFSRWNEAEETHLLLISNDVYKGLILRLKTFATHFFLNCGVISVHFCGWYVKTFIFNVWDDLRYFKHTVFWGMHAFFQLSNNENSYTWLLSE